MTSSQNEIPVRFICQQCLLPLDIDPSFRMLNESVIANLTTPITSSNDIDLGHDATNFDHFVPAYRFTDSKTNSNGFTFIDNKKTSEELSRQISASFNLYNIFDILSNNSEIDHPLCEECADGLLNLMDQQLKFTEEEYQAYSQFLKSAEYEDDFDDFEQLEKELESLKGEETRLIEELKLLQEDEKKAKEKLEEEELEKIRLDTEENGCWREYSRHSRDLMIAEDESRSLDCQYQFTQAQLERLKQTNVFNATFHIWHSDGHFGTINNLRLGRLPTAPVDWSEINAAWGQTALLLSALARKIGLVFKRYRVVPYGNHSYIEVLSDNKELPLYGSGGFRFLWDTKFDSGMIAFLDCLEQFKEEMEKVHSDFRLPYKMVKGKLEDASTGSSLSIKIQFNSEEQWTKALKFMLTNLKWALAWVSSRFVKAEEET